MKRFTLSREHCTLACMLLFLLVFCTGSGCASRGENNSARNIKANPSWVPRAASIEATMLQSAGRKTNVAQPEVGFRMQIPASIGDGEPFMVEFAAQDAKSVSFTFRNKSITLDKPVRGKFQAMLPMKLDEKAKSLPLAMTVRWENGKSEQFRANIPVVLRDYPVQRLKVNPKFVTPPPELAEKIKQDRAEIRSTVTKVTPQQYWSLPLQRPVPGRVSSVFGVRRVFNGVPKSSHRGVDFRGAAGTPIQAVESGVVALVSNHYYGGNTVIVDHGLGVFSVYLHMSQFNTQKGQQVKRGDIIGYIGSTGRSTGPHLHYSFYVLGESVNGATCLDLK